MDLVEGAQDPNAKRGVALPPGRTARLAPVGGKGTVAIVRQIARIPLVDLVAGEPRPLARVALA